MARVVASSCGRFLLSCGTQFLRKFLSDQNEEPVHFEFDTDGNDLGVNGNNLAVACQDGSVKLYDLKEATLKKDLFGGSSPAKDLTFSPDGSWVSVSAYDRSTIVNVNDINQTKTVPIPSRHITWHPVENFVSVSGQDGVLYFYNLDKQEIENKLEGILPATDIADSRSTSAEWSPSGDVFGVPSKSFDFVVYDREKLLEQFRLVHKEAIQRCKWSPNGRYIASLLVGGAIYIWSVSDRNILMIEKPDSPAVDIVWHQNENKLSYIDKVGMVQTFTPVSSSYPAPFGEVVPVEYKRTSTMDDLILSGSEDEQEDMIDLEDDEEEDAYDRSSKRIRMDIQPFQSGSTPWNARKRILCTNYNGYVWSTYQDDQHNTVTITFFDQGEHKDAHIRDEEMYDIAALSKEATFLANRETGKAFLRFHNSRLDSWDIACHDGIRSVALSSKLAVICTTNGYIRTFTLWGNPISVTREARDPVVTCAAHEDMLMIVRHNGGGFNYSLEDTQTQQYFQKNDPLDVSSSNRLTHLFFSDNGDPCIYDSSGVLSTLVHWRNPLQARWVPIFGDRDDKNEKYWPIGTIESQLLCIILRGQRQHPAVPLVTTSQLDLKVPGLDGDEASYILRNTRYMQLHAIASAEDQLDKFQDELDETETELDRSLLVQLQAALGDSKTNKALAIASLLHKPEAIQIAAKIAVRYNLPSVAERIQAIAE